jgi:hypothetical protein
LARRGNPSAAFLSLASEEQQQFPGPIGQRQAQPLQVRIPGSDLRLDVRDLLAVARDSCRVALAFLSDLV